MKHLLSTVALGIMLATGTLAISGCDRAGNTLVGSKLNLENYDKLHTGMSKTQAQEIMGAPSTEETKDVLVYKRTTWRYTEGDKFVQLTFKNDELDGKESNLSK